MALFSISIIVGLFMLVLSADKFVDGASNLARHYGMSPLLIGMVIIGFGTSSPEMFVSGISSFQGSPGIAIGNAYGSNITNIALILGLTSLIFPISVQSQVLKKELPILLIVTLLSLILFLDFNLSKFEALVLIIVFMSLMFWSIREGIKNSKDNLAVQVKDELNHLGIPIRRSYLLIIGGLILLIISSQLLVYGAVGIAKIFGVSDIVVGLTVVAVGTSLPELAASVVAAKKGEADIAFGNVLGSNLFNTLAVVGIAGLITPIKIDSEVLSRDIGTMTFLTFSLFVFGYGFKKQGRINRYEGVLLLIIYISYTNYLIKSAN